MKFRKFCSIFLCCATLGSGQYLYGANHLGTEFGQYDDPKPNGRIRLYACFEKSPIGLSDRLRDTVSLPNGATMTGVITPAGQTLISRTNDLIKEHNKKATPIESPKFETYMDDAHKKEVSENGVDVTIPGTGWFNDKANVSVNIYIITIQEMNPNNVSEDIVLQYHFTGYALIEVIQNGNTYETRVPIIGQMNSTVHYKSSNNFTGVPYIPHNIPTPNRKKSKKKQ
jgi:hypothetical protein